ncbi:MAG: DUF4097 domain-containing protein [Oscillospiraceae bacterium]|jgi:DUF4097 and DUF4098 domain-containing protein YvlB|nr:DUF4097 domain-containing protein [Oscillospiraceae bacterium]
MKKWLKVVLITAGTLLLLGTGLLLAAFAMLGFDIARIHDHLAEQNQYEGRTYSLSAADVRVLEISARNHAIVLEDYEGDAVRIEYANNANVRFDELREGDRMILRQQSHTQSGWRSFFRVSYFDYAAEIRVYVPKDALLTAYFNSTNGGINVRGAAFRELRLDTQNGKLHVTSVTCEGEIRLKTSNGALDIAQVRASGLTGETSNGQLRADSVTCGGEIQLKTSNGAVSFSKLEGTRVALHSSNGAITGQADFNAFTVTARTSNASLRLGASSSAHGGTLTEGTGAAAMELRTSNGRIDVQRAQ